MDSLCFRSTLTPALLYLRWSGSSDELVAYDVVWESRTSFASNQRRFASYLRLSGILASVNMLSLRFASRGPGFCSQVTQCRFCLASLSQLTST